MKAQAYEAEAARERDHWWFVGRRRLFGRMIGRMGLAPASRVLDIGTSTGTNLRLLTDMGFRDVHGLDTSEAAIAFCRSKGLPEVALGDICAIPHDSDTWDLVLATDVIEHVDDDRRAVHEVFRVLKPGGYALFTVPMLESLWGLQDDISLHKRRYRRSEFLGLFESTDFEVLDSFHFNFILFLPIWLARRLMRVFNVGAESENSINNGFVNAVLTGLFGLDTRLAPFLRPPFGVSCLALVRKPPRGEGRHGSHRRGLGGSWGG